MSNDGRVSFFLRMARRRRHSAHHCAPALPPGNPTLAALSGTFTLAENAEQDDVAGSITGKTSGSALSLLDDAGGRVALDGLNVVRGAVALDYEDADEIEFTVRETLGAATNTPRDTVLTLTVTDADEVPNAFSFTDATNVNLSATATSNAITVAGLGSGASTPVTVSNGEYRKNGGSWTTSAGAAVNGDQFEVRHTSSASYVTATNTVLTIGGVSDTFTSTTRAWAPSDLGVKLLAFFDAEDPSQLTLSGSNVTTWTDPVSGAAPTQGTAGFKPVYSATSFNSRPGVTFDGTDDQLTLGSVPASFPVSAVPCEMWGLVDQQAAGADTTTRSILAYGNVNTSRNLARASVSSVNHARIGVGTGAAVTSATGTVTMDGVHVARGQVGATACSIETDGADNVGASAVPATATSRTRLGGNANSGTPAGFFNGTINAVLVTAPLTAGEATSLLDYLKARGGLP